MDLVLEDDWITKFNETDAVYKDFYKDDLYYVNLKFIYVNRESEIEKIKYESFRINELALRCEVDEWKSSSSGEN